MDKRTLTQIIATAATNANLKGFVEGKIYRGDLKNICVPGLNCYSCPGAIGSCPIGSMQAVVGSAKYNFSLYITGLMALMGVALGRFICGWLCPFGLLQDLIHKNPLPKVKVSERINKVLKGLKYVVLIVLVILMPMLVTNPFGNSQPFFCQYLCPVGTLEGGIPLVLLKSSLRQAIGFLFLWKMLILVVIILLSLIIYRPFCKYLCPLGAFYSLFNGISFYRYGLDKSKCTQCNICTNSCKMDIEVYKTPNNPECIRCGKCIKACPSKALKNPF